MKAKAEAFAAIRRRSARPSIDAGACGWSDAAFQLDLAGVIELPPVAAQARMACAWCRRGWHGAIAGS